MLTTVDSKFPKITEEGLDELRRRIGAKIGVTAEPWCYEATRDNIRHYAHGIGDDNPLWCVPEYAKKTKFGDVIALPSFLFATSRIISGYVGGLPGIHAMWSGSDWHWHKTVNRNDEITTEAWLKDLIVHDTKFAGRAVQQIYHVDFFNQKGDLVADADSWCFRTERDHAREKGTKLDELRQRIGVKIGVTAEPWCHEATRDNIRHYAHGIGDDNPLWCVPEYARKTRFGDVIALPSFLFATSRIVSGYVGGLPGIHAMWSGSDWNWHKTVHRNDEIRTEAWLKDLIVHETKFAGRAVQQIYHVDFFNQMGELVADADSWCFRTERDHAREQGTKYKELRARPPRRYTERELADAYRLYAEEKIRGAEKRFWQDATEGEALPTMVKGPMTVTGFIAYAQGWGGLYIRANKLAWKLVDAHPGLGIANRFGIPDCPERVHWEEEFAHEVGAPGAYDYGPERASWLTHHLTNWMGDDGILRNATCKIRRHNPAGDILFIKGKVKRKYIEGGRHLAEIEQEARNQDDELSVLGTGIVELPSR